MTWAQFTLCPCQARIAATTYRCSIFVSSSLNKKWLFTKSNHMLQWWRVGPIFHFVSFPHLNLYSKISSASYLVIVDKLSTSAPEPDNENTWAIVWVDKSTNSPFTLAFVFLSWYVLTNWVIFPLVLPSPHHAPKARTPKSLPFPNSLDCSPLFVEVSWESLRGQVTEPGQLMP